MQALFCVSLEVLNRIASWHLETSTWLVVSWSVQSLLSEKIQVFQPPSTTRLAFPIEKRFRFAALLLGWIAFTTPGGGCPLCRCAGGGGGNKCSNFQNWYLGFRARQKKPGNPNFNVTYGEVMLMVKLDTGKTSIAWSTKLWAHVQHSKTPPRQRLVTWNHMNGRYLNTLCYMLLWLNIRVCMRYRYSSTDTAWWMKFSS